MPLSEENRKYAQQLLAELRGLRGVEVSAEEDQAEKEAIRLIIVGAGGEGGLGLNSIRNILAMAPAPIIIPKVHHHDVIDDFDRARDMNAIIISIIHHHDDLAAAKNTNLIILNLRAVIPISTRGSERQIKRIGGADYNYLHVY
jgi:hypothetical protein